MRKLNTMTVLCVGCFLTAQQFAFQPAAHGYQSVWRQHSRHARRLIDENDYPKAVAYYNKAISELNSEDPQSEYLYDLILNLAETHILAGAYIRAQVLLDQIEPAIASKDFSDPLLPVRFWRRKTQLYYKQGNLARAIQDYTKALDIFGKHFLHSSDHYQGQLRKLIGMMCENKDWVQVAAFLPQVRKPEKDSSMEMYYLTLESASSLAMKSGDLKSSGEILAALSNSDPHTDTLISQWNAWSDMCLATKQLEKTSLAETNIQKLIKTIAPNSAKNIRTLASGHYALAAIYLRRNDLAHSEGEFRRTREMVLQLKENKLDVDYMLLATASVTIASNNIKNRNFSPETQTLLQEVVELSRMPQATAKLGKSTSFGWYHCISRFHLARYYSRKLIFDKVIQTIDSIDKKTLSVFPELAEKASKVRNNAVEELKKETSARSKQ